MTWQDHADRALNGKLKATLIAWRKEGLTIDEVAHRFETEHSLPVSRETIRRTLDELALSTPTKAAS